MIIPCCRSDRAFIKAEEVSRSIGGVSHLAKAHFSTEADCDLSQWSFSTR